MGGTKKREYNNNNTTNCSFSKEWSIHWGAALNCHLYELSK